MQKLIELAVFRHLAEDVKAHPDFIHVILGPRQVGKTTGIHQFIELIKDQVVHYMSADSLVPFDRSWFEKQWIQLKTQSSDGILIIDEVQKVEGWSEVLKKLWDEQARLKKRLKVILLGSSSLEIQRGLSESLTGRFVLHQVHQWNHRESKEAYNLSLEDFLLFGGYPGSYPLRRDRVKWLSYLNHSIIDTVIGKDILQLARVKSPALFKQSFDLACAYGGQEISYTKLLGQLQDRGNVELVKHYLELFEGAFLIKQLYKYSAKKTLSRSSSPKLLPLCPALYSVTLDAKFNHEQRGRAFEIAVGCELSRWPGQLYYWREKNDEVDYVHKFGNQLNAIEVKSGRKKSSRGLIKFKENFPNSNALIVTPENYETILTKVRAQLED